MVMVLGGGSGGPLPDGQAHRHQPNMVRHTGTNQITKQHVFRCFTIHVLRIACSESMPKCDLNHIHVLPLFAAFFTVLPLFASASSWGPSQDRHQQRFATAAVPSISATGLGVIARSELGNGGGIRHEPDGLPVQSRRRPSDGSRRRRDQRRRQWRRPSFLDHQRHVHLMFMIDWHGSRAGLGESLLEHMGESSMGTTRDPARPVRHPVRPSASPRGPEAQCVRGVIQ